MDSTKYDICVLCEHARMRTDICGIYCVGSYFKKDDGSCDHFCEHVHWMPMPEPPEEADHEAENQVGH